MKNIKVAFMFGAGVERIKNIDLPLDIIFNNE